MRARGDHTGASLIIPSPRALRVALCYPPAAYFFMPYLAPYLLKGYLGSVSIHKVWVHDLNIDYHLHTWGEHFGAEGAVTLRAEARGEALRAELLALKGLESLKALRYSPTYIDASAVRSHVLLLKSAAQIAARVDTINGASARTLPAAREQWVSVLDRATHSTVGRYIAKAVNRGLYVGNDVVGITISYVEQLVPSLLLARFLRRRDPRMKIVLGGNMVTHFLPEIVADYSLWNDIDYCIPYEGEWDFLALLNALAEGRSDSLPNVASLQRGRIEYRKDLSARPHIAAIPDFSDFKHLHPTPRPIYPLLTSKGCYWGRCGFCTHHEGYGQGANFWPRQQVRATIEALARDGAREFYFVDEALPFRSIGEISDAFTQVRKTLPPGERLEWMAECRAEKNLARDVSVDALARSGCRVLISGVESGSQSLIDHMEKGISLGATEEIAHSAHARGIRIGWMFFVGFPGETEENALETFRFIARNVSHIDFAAVGTFMLERGSPLWNEPHRFGVKKIFEKEKPYPIGFDYELVDGSVVNHSILTARRDGLIRDTPQIHYLLRAAIDRALALFLPIESQHAPVEHAPPSFTYRWNSNLVGAPVEFDLVTQRIIVRHAP